jgi:hypothetical protein
MKHLAFGLGALGLLGSVVFSCVYHKKESDPKPVSATATTTQNSAVKDTTKGTTTAPPPVNTLLIGCDDTINISYSATIQPIFANACYSCHKTNNNQFLYDFENFQSLNNYLIGTTSGGVKGNNFYHDLSTGYMPLNASPLTPCELKQIYVWLQNGGLNN